MPLFQCSKCGCVENTAVSLYWMQEDKNLVLCSECDPQIGKWHEIFPKKSAIGYLLGNDGFLYQKEAYDAGQLNHRIEHQGFKIINTIKSDPVIDEK